MSGLGIRLYTDEDVDPEIAVQLRRRGYDAESCHEAGNAGQRRSDEWQLGYAAEHSRAFLTHNIADFAALDRAWKARRQEHRGIIARQDLAIGEMILRIQAHLDRSSRGEQRSVTLYLARPA